MYYLLRLITIIFTLLPRRIALKLGQLLGVFFYYLTQRILVIPTDENGNEIPRTQLFPSASPKN